MNPWAGIVLVCAALTALVAGLRLLQRTWLPNGELIRKLLHIGMGLLTLTFPLIFQATWPVWLLAAVSIGAMVVLKTQKTLKAKFGGVIHSVERESFGEMYYPLAVALVFQLARDNALLYTIPILLLAVADAVAALIGIRYGKNRYTTAEGFKSLEGSTAFLLVAFVCVAWPVYIYTSLPLTHIIMVALLIALLVMLMEAVAWRGLDNLLVPLGTYLLLNIYFSMAFVDLLARLAVLMVLTLFMLNWQKRSTLNDSAALGGILVGYYCWAVGGWQWLLPPLFLFVVYSILENKDAKDTQSQHSIFAVISVAAPGAVWLYINAVMGDSLAGGAGAHALLLFPFALAFSAHMALIGIARIKYHYPGQSNAVVLTVSVVQAFVMMMATYLFWRPASSSLLWEYAIALAAVITAAALFMVLQPRLHDCPTDGSRWWRQGAIGAGVSLLGLIPLGFAS